MSSLREKQLENLILKYEEALRWMEEAYDQALSDDNVGTWRPKYVSAQEQAASAAEEVATKAREDAKRLNVQLPEPKPFGYPLILRPGYVERQPNTAVEIKDLQPLDNNQ
jgi:hypothetical protein